MIANDLGERTTPCMVGYDGEEGHVHPGGVGEWLRGNWESHGRRADDGAWRHVVRQKRPPSAAAPVEEVARRRVLEAMEDLLIGRGFRQSGEWSRELWWLSQM